MIREILVEALREREHDRRPGWIGASEIGSCPLSVALRLRGIKPQVDDRSLLTMHVGTCVHIGLQKILGDHLRNVERRLEDPKLQLSGHPDGTFGHELVEFKTISPWALKSADRRAGLPYPHHRVQAHALAYLLVRENITIHSIRYVYIDKSSGEIIEIEEPLRTEVIEEVLLRVGTIRELVNEPLEKVCLTEVHDWLDWNSGTKKDPRPWNCRYCAFSHACPIVGRVEEEARQRMEASA